MSARRGGPSKLTASVLEVKKAIAGACGFIAWALAQGFVPAQYKSIAEGVIGTASVWGIWKATNGVKAP